jgi:hypothetical protein
MPEFGIRVAERLHRARERLEQRLQLRQPARFSVGNRAGEPGGYVQDVKNSPCRVR